MNIIPTIQPMQRNAGSARLSVTGVSGNTMLENLYQSGNAKLRIPERYESGPLEAVMINIAGGMTGGDTLDWDFSAHDNAELTLTSQACEKIYKSSSGQAVADIALNASSGSHINWLPQETIVFDRANLLRKVNIDLSDNASALIVEALVFGRKAMGEIVKEAAIRDRWRVQQNGALIHAEELWISGPIDEQLSNKAIAAGNKAIATVLFVSPTAEQSMAQLNNIIGENGAVSCWNGKLLLRILAMDSYDLRRTLIPVIQCLSGGQKLPKCWTL
ncbi:urease accessory protein UreD [Ahrensia sp. 13_GOM-1096m]|uniref:urease accessory protein UreD n=1 Tax=Ahrensia sp. 13_GOM-1096m TaxID=1380380 RepID=UPI00047B8ECF|nr:urease accessory protein UreD [Ahrensia sp. 13_GOM-1096m]